MRTIPFIDTESLTIPRIIPFAGLLLLFILTAFALSLQLNRQSTISQEIGLNQTAHALVYHGGQLAYEQRQLHDLVAKLVDTAAVGNQNPAMTAEIAAHQTQIAAHLQSLYLPDEPYSSPSMSAIAEDIEQYRSHWDRLAVHLDLLQSTSQEQSVYQQIEGELVVMDRLLYQIVEGGQQLFTTRLENWLGSLYYLNRLLVSATVILLITVLLVSYLFYLFFSLQSNVEQALRDSAGRLHAILDTIPDAVLRLRRNGNIVDHKPAQLHQPFTTSNCIGTTLAQIVPSAIAQQLQATADQVFETGQQQTLEYTLPMADGGSMTTVEGERTFEARFLPTANDEIQLLVRDVTSEKAADAATLQAQKLESIGLLAGGIAHDFNNILTGLLAQTTLARRKAENGLPITGNLDKAILSANRAADLTRQLLAYAGQGKFQIGPLHLNQLIDETTALLETALTNGAQLTLDLASMLPPIQADRGQIQQVVMNLVINAAEALPHEQGNVHVRTALQTIDTNTEFVDYMGKILTPGQYVLLAVSDNGIGMDQAMLARIFDPFFSTKPTGHGLGLSAVLGIVHAHQGGLHVESHPGRGTTFTMLLPAHCEATKRERMRPNTVNAPIDLDRAILVIDDEAPVRDAICDILSDRGFAVMTAADGAEGIATLQHQSDAIGIVLLDVRMPGMTGVETYQQLRRIQPNIKVIFTSGYSETELAVDVNDTEGVAFLAKPYSAECLTEYVHAMMKR